MEQHITPDRIANSIMQNTRFSGHHLLVEGMKDLKVYSKFFNKDQVCLTQTFGKYNLRDAFSILSSRNFTKKLAIRDADFLRVSGNEKYDENYQDEIYVTDGHDSEVMMLAVDTLEDMLSVTIPPDKIEAFEQRLGESFRARLLRLAYQIGCLRLANKRGGLGLSFKPATRDGNKIKFKKFMCDKTFTINIDHMIHVVTEYSKNRGVVVSSRELIKAQLEEILTQSHSELEVVNGHDISEITCYLASVGIKSKNHIFQFSDRLEEALALSFDREKFRRTQLFQKIDSWKEKYEIAAFFAL